MRGRRDFLFCFPVYHVLFSVVIFVSQTGGGGLLYLGLVFSLFSFNWGSVVQPVIQKLCFSNLCRESMIMNLLLT